MTSHCMSQDPVKGDHLPGAMYDKAASFDTSNIRITLCFEQIIYMNALFKQIPHSV